MTRPQDVRTVPIPPPPPPQTHLESRKSVMSDWPLKGVSLVFFDMF